MFTATIEGGDMNKGNELVMFDPGKKFDNIKIFDIAPNETSSNPRYLTPCGDNTCMYFVVNLEKQGEQQVMRIDNTLKFTTFGIFDDPKQGPRNIYDLKPCGNIGLTFTGDSGNGNGFYLAYREGIVPIWFNRDGTRPGRNINAILSISEEKNYPLKLTLIFDGVDPKYKRQAFRWDFDESTPVPATLLPVLDSNGDIFPDAIPNLYLDD